MLDNPTARRSATREIARDAMRGENDDPMGELNPLNKMFFSSRRTAIYIPILDDVVARRCLLELSEGIFTLIAEMDRIDNRRSKCLLVDSTLRKWNQAFARRVWPNGRK